MAVSRRPPALRLPIVLTTVTLVTGLHVALAVVGPGVPVGNTATKGDAVEVDVPAVPVVAPSVGLRHAFRDVTPQPCGPVLVARGQAPIRPGRPVSPTVTAPVTPRLVSRLGVAPAARP